ncbi:MAG: sugar phosphate isomerase/epimerase family protein [Planctomycetota bacterium]
MSKFSRRELIIKSGNALSAAALAGLAFGCQAKQARGPGWHGFKYAMCNESMAELSWSEQCQIVGDAGYGGIEIAAFTLVNEGVHEIGPAKRREMVSAMDNAGLECVGLHWLLAPPPEGLHFTTPDAAVRRRTIAYLNQLIEFCGDLGGHYMIFGSPKQRDTKGISVREAKRHFTEGLTAVADHAQKREIKILIEPLAKRATDVVNTLAEASQLAEQVDHPAIKIMFDFNNTGDETQAFDVLIKKHRKSIHHVHVQEQGGKHLGTGTAVNDYVKAFQTLKDLKCSEWVSLEVFDFSPGGRTIAEESMKVLKQIEGKLV